MSRELSKIKLSKMEQKILAAILDRTVIGGAELVRYAGASRPNELFKSVSKLKLNELIEVSGDIQDEMMFPYASFGIRPSSKETLRDLLQQHSLT